MRLEELRSELSALLPCDSFAVRGDVEEMTLDPFCAKCDALLDRDERELCRSCARIRTSSELD